MKLLVPPIIVVYRQDVNSNTVKRIVAWKDMPILSGDIVQSNFMTIVFDLLFMQSRFALLRGKICQFDENNVYQINEADLMLFSSNPSAPIKKILVSKKPKNLNYRTFNKSETPLKIQTRGGVLGGLRG